MAKDITAILASSCGSCKHFHNVTDVTRRAEDQSGDCRRHPPLPIAIAGGGEACGAVYPLVQATTPKCAEYENKAVFGRIGRE